MGWKWIAKFHPFIGNKCLFNTRCVQTYIGIASLSLCIAGIDLNSLGTLIHNDYLNSLGTLIHYDHDLWSPSLMASLEDGHPDATGS